MNIPVMHLRGWVVVQMRTPPRNGDDLHVVPVIEDASKEFTYLRYKSRARITQPVLCKPFRYRSGARKFKGFKIREMNLGRSHWLQGCEPEVSL